MFLSLRYLTNGTSGIDSMKALALIGFLSFTIACTKEKERAASRQNSDSGGALLQPAGPSDTGRHARLLAQMFRADANGHRKTFGFTPPDSTEISLVTDVELYHKADRALDSTLIAMGGTKSSGSKDNGSLYVYRAGDLYALVDVNQQPRHAIALPIFFFFDSRWRYLGSRSN